VRIICVSAVRARTVGARHQRVGGRRRRRRTLHATAPAHESRREPHTQ
jgi:hypothetical protein